MTRMGDLLQWRELFDYSMPLKEVSAPPVSSRRYDQATAIGLYGKIEKACRLVKVWVIGGDEIDFQAALPQAVREDGPAYPIRVQA
jgi:hypothetical protein